jgi:hypothetical protein
MQYIIISIIIIFFIFYLLNNIILLENFYPLVTTWTPYVMDVYNQPSYSNYFYKNGYMYPVY